MKRSLLSALVGMAVLAFAGTAWAGIAGTDHDLGPSGQQICVYCHTPHNANTTVGVALWNRQSSTATYTMYSSPTIDMTIAGTPQGVSLACLSCHDGTLAFDALLNPPGGATNSGNMTGSEKVGPDLSNDHPISITYDTAADPAFVAPTAGKVGTLPLFGSSANQVECATCHSVHDDTNKPFLRVANTGSALCTTCHQK